MTAMPQMVALFNGVGGGAVALIAWAEASNTDGYANEHKYMAPASLIAAMLDTGSSRGSYEAIGKLQEILPGKPITLGKLQQPVNVLVLLGAVACGVAIAVGADSEWLMIGLLVLAALVGLFVVLPIGGADMPVVI